MTPLVSILIPCHNAGRWIAATLDSALAQTWTRTETIVVDDGSKDDSAAIVTRYAGRGVRLLTQPNRGASAARNAALAAARGEFIQYLDADDLLSPGKIAQQLEVLATRPPDTLALGEWGRFTIDPTTAVFHPETVYRAGTGVEFLQLHYETGSMMQPGGWLAPRSLLDRAGPWDESLSLNDDGEYFARVMLAASGLVFTPGARCFYRASLGSLSRRHDLRSLQSLHRSVELTTAHFLAADASPRSRAAAAYAWKWAAFELYPAAPALSADAWQRCLALGGSDRPFPGGPRFQRLARFFGWHLAKRLRDFLTGPSEPS